MTPVKNLIDRPILATPSQPNGINFPVCLAPMVGLTHVATRLLVRDYLPQDARTIWPTEMLSSRRLPHENLKTTPETMRADRETELVPQILGNEEKFIAASAEKLVEWGAEGLDINMGCPVRKALQHNYGVALMGDPDYAWEVTRMTVKHARVPVSVKLRAGENGDVGFLTRFVQGLEQAGASWIALHPRTAAQMRRGSADWSQISQIRAKIKIPVIGNGDVQTADDVLRMLDETGCDAAMVGRALTARPWMLWQVGEKLGFAPPEGRSGPAPATPEEEGAEYGRALLKLLDYVEMHFIGENPANENLGLRKFRFFVKTGSVWLLFGHQLYANVMKAKTLPETRAAVENFFAMPQPMSERTELRQ